jgi:hypothetical protein
MSTVKGPSPQKTAKKRQILEGVYLPNNPFINDSFLNSFNMELFL